MADARVSDRLLAEFEAPLPTSHDDGRRVSTTPEECKYFNGR
jgi:hypothetical protein